MKTMNPNVGLNLPKSKSNTFLLFLNQKLYFSYKIYVFEIFIVFANRLLSDKDIVMFDKKLKS